MHQHQKLHFQPEHFDQSESISTTCVVETGDSNVIPDSPDMCDNDIQDDQNDVECDNERAALANLKLDVDENKKIQKQLKKANATLSQELTMTISLGQEQSGLVQYDTDDNVFAMNTTLLQSYSITNACAVETGDSNIILDSPNMCDNDIQDDQNDVECDDERVALANLIANLKLDVDENKKIQKQLKKANATLTQELTECKSILGN
ncbi:hypothetical protein Tco_0286896 [Tanacetum coccineum]